MADQYDGDQQTHTDNPTRFGISHDQCFNYLKRYIHKDKPELQRFYNNDDKIKDTATKALGMVNELWNDGEGSTVEIAHDMRVLVLYDLVMLNGMFLIN
jgi:hypothetical protein